MEHRYGRRISIEIAVEIESDDGSRCPARICNFSISGIYLAVPWISLRLYQHVVIELRAPAGQGRYRINGHIARLEDDGIAVMLDGSISAALDAYDLLCEFSQAYEAIPVRGISTGDIAPDRLNHGSNHRIKPQQSKPQYTLRISAKNTE
jgi:hypothetical protein